MHSETLAFYARHAPTCAASYSQVAPDYGLTWEEAFLVSRSKILDIGCGVGRDLAGLLALGYDAHGLEPVTEMRLEAIRRYPELAGRIVEDGLPLSSTSLASATFNGIVCAAVLMHIPENELQKARDDICRVLEDGGRLLVTLPAEPSSAHRRGSDDSRLFLPSDVVLSLFGDPSFSTVKRAERPDALGRPIRWITVLFEYRRLDNSFQQPGGPQTVSQVAKMD